MFSTPRALVNMQYLRIKFCFVVFSIIVASSCGTRKADPVMFEILKSDQTHLDFANKLTSTDSFNLFHYMYFYNGAGVGAGDFNNDGLIDLFFASNQGANKIYLNTGNLTFKDVTTEAGIPNDNSWSTGVSIVDINNDGLLDIYICKVGRYQSLRSKNQLLICTGINSNHIPTFKDSAQQYGLDFSGFSTQAAFLDYDMDGDLDMFLLNHSVHQNGTFRPRSEFVGTYNELSGDRLYRNDGGKFTDVTKLCGINSSAISYGLGIGVSDINLDGYPDLYVGNDFHENDYLYINQHDGTFKDVLNDEIMHTSQFSMGVDVADADNDGYPEIISMDMLPDDPYILKRSLGEDEHDIFFRKIDYGYNYQYTRNNLQWNRRNGMFSEIGLYAGVAATDWSWAPLWMDFDNDGLKDLFITNGIPKRMNDIDYINYISNTEVQQKLRENNYNNASAGLIDKFPEIKIPNKLYRNVGHMQFADLEKNIGNNQQTFSSGAIYADFDNDGDLDVVVNNIDEPAMLYRNTLNDQKSHSFKKITLKGPQKNVNAVGARVIAFAKEGVRTYEKYPVHGFVSSMETPMLIGLENSALDSLLLVWPDNTYQQINSSDSLFTIAYKPGLPQFNYEELKHSQITSYPVGDITSATGLLYEHKEDRFPEFDREPLIPHEFSTEGPAIAVSDLNKDGFEDVFIGSSKTGKSKIFLQQSNGTFVLTQQPLLEKDSMYEPVDACWTDLNNDGNPDLVIAGGGNEYYGEDSNLLPRAYLNDGHANLTRIYDAFSRVYTTASCVAPYDFNGDGYPDLFIGGRVVPWEYGVVPRSYLLVNNGKGQFKDVSDEVASELSHIGFVTNATWADLDKDGDKDLLVTLEWGGIIAFENNHGKFSKRIITEKKGWWNFATPVDIDNDGDLDLVAGNLGLNTRLLASEKEPVRMYYADFDDNGKKDQVISYYLKGKEIPFANKSELEKQMPVLKKKYLYAEDFAKASLKEIFGNEKLQHAAVFTADYFSNSILVNDGNWKFHVKPLPWQAQLTPYREAAVVDANDDDRPDLLLFGNYYENNIEMGRYDADYGSVLINEGKDSFRCESLNGIVIKGQVRHIRPISIASKQAFIVARNNDSLRIIQFKKR